MKGLRSSLYYYIVGIISNISSSALTTTGCRAPSAAGTPLLHSGKLLTDAWTLQWHTTIWWIRVSWFIKAFVIRGGFFLLMSRWAMIYGMFLYTEKIIVVWNALWYNFFQNSNSCWTRLTSVSHKARQPLWHRVNLAPLGCAASPVPLPLWHVPSTPMPRHPEPNRRAWARPTRPIFCHRTKISKSVEDWDMQR